MLICEAGVVGRGAVFADHVDDLGRAQVAVGEALLVGVGIERDASLLFQYRRVTLLAVEPDAAEVASHDSSSCALAVDMGLDQSGADPRQLRPLNPSRGP